METTGLDPSNCYLLELSVTVLDEDTLIPLGSKTWVFDFTVSKFGHLNANPPAVRQQMLDWVVNQTDPFVQDMHTTNGLWQELRTRTDLVSYARGSTQIAAYISEFIYEKGPNDKGVIPKPRLCGASPRLDLNFIDAFLPTVADLLHYRIIDVSSLRWIAERAGAVLPDRPNDSTHRAADDVAWTVQLLQDIDTALA